MSLCARQAIIGLAAMLAASMVVAPADAKRRRHAERIETEAHRPFGEPLMAVVSLSHQRVTIYDANGWILRAPVSSGQRGYETPAGIYAILQKEEEHYSNLYDDASMPYMQRITWSGIALHAGLLPGYPASHGCVRMPYEFAQRLFDMTKVGMRVVVARDDVHPVEIEHPALFEPKPVRPDITLKALAEHWDGVRARMQEPSPEAVVPPPAGAAEPLVTLKSVAAAKLAEVNQATQRAAAAKLAAARLTLDAARSVRAAEAAKSRAEAQVKAVESVESAISASSSSTEIGVAGSEKIEAHARLAEAEAELAAAREGLPLKADAASRAREEARAAEAEKAAAMEASVEVTRMLAPLSVFVSRKTQRLYVRQSLQPVLEIPISIRDAAEPIGTHIYTALGYGDDDAHLRWSVVSMYGNPDRRLVDPIGKTNDDRHVAGLISPDATFAAAALDRLEIPQEIADRISEVISPGSSLIISDEGMSAETGEDTDFVILMSGESQGGIKMRHPSPEARDHHHHRYSDRPYWRSPVYAPSFDGGPFFVPW